MRVQPVLPSPPRREWLELASFWKAGHTGQVWFLADPRRTDLALIDPQSRADVTAIRWAPASRPVFGGMRPAAVDWVRMRAPRWFAEEGWALTPETAGMARLMGRGPHLGPIVARVRRDPAEVRVLIGGRNLAAAGDPAVRFTMAIDGRDGGQLGRRRRASSCARSMLPAGALDGRRAACGAHRAVDAAVTATAVIPTAIEQFDVQLPETLMWGFDAGWHEAEYTPALGVWHWTSERSSLRVHRRHDRRAGRDRFRIAATLLRGADHVACARG